MPKQKKTVTTTTTTVTTTVTNGPVKEVYDAFVIDRSGSMSSIWKATIDGANEYINKSQRTAVDTGAKATLSLLWFDDQFITQYDNTPIADVQPLKKTENMPRGGTALNDAVAKMINRMKELLGNRAASDDVDVTITVFTDGDENMSKEFPGYGNAALKAMIEDVQNRLKWTVTYVGAGKRENVNYAAASIGISLSNVANYSHDIESTTKMFKDLSAARSVKTMSYMAGMKSNTGYFKPSITSTTTPTVTNTQADVDPTDK